MATMNTNIKINIVEPGSSTPVDPTPIDPVDPSDTTNTTTYTSSTDISVPDTGLFTHSVGAKEVAVLSITIFIILTIIALLSLHYSKKHGKVTIITKLLSRYKSTLQHNKATTLGLTILAIVVSLGTLATLIKTGVNAIDPVDSTNSNSTSNESTNSSNTTITTDDMDIIEASLEDGEVEIPLGDKPVFAKIPVTITVDEAMSAGYTIKAYAENPDFISTSEDDATITMITPIDDVVESLSLADNTWGLSTTNPSLPTDNIFYSLPQSQDNATILTDSDYEETEANSTFTFYYNIYITPDLPYGTYTGAVVSYDIEENKVAKIIFDSNGLYFDGDITNTSNVVIYGEGVTTDKTELYSHTPNVDNTGLQNGFYPIDFSNTFVYNFADATTVHVNIVRSGNDSCCGPDSGDYFTFWAGSHPDYTAVDYMNDSIHAPDNENGGYNNTGQYMFGAYNNLEMDIDDTSSVTFAYSISSNRGNSSDSSAPYGGGYGYYAIISATDVNGNPAYAIENKSLSGEYKIPATSEIENYEFLGWSTDPTATVPKYNSDADVVGVVSPASMESITLYAVWRPAAFTISYDGNNATAGSMVSDGTTLVHSDVKAGDTINLYAPNYKKDGYGFAGWSTDIEAWVHLVDDDETNNPTIYGPSESIMVDRDMALAAGGETMILYAVWVPAETDANGNLVTLQGWQGCSNLTPTTYDAETNTLNVGRNTIVALTDNRDGDVYAIARLADGNCWMLENLRLSGPIDLTSDNTNNPVLSKLVSDNYNLDSCDQYDCYFYPTGQHHSPVNTQINNNQRIASYRGSGYNVKWYSYGTYYNWTAATAGNGGFAQNSGNVPGDVCPAGWHLPYGGDSVENQGGNTSGGFYYLNQQMGGNTSSIGSDNWRSFPNNFVIAGEYIRNEGRTFRAYPGAYWTSVYGGFNNGFADYAGVYVLGVDIGYLNPNTGINHGNSDGLSIRCVTLAE